MTDGFQFPETHITEVVEEDGVLYEQVVEGYACDFCYDKRVIWEYTTDEFALEEINFASAEQWLVCAECARLVENRELPTMTVRILKSWAALGLSKHVDDGAIDGAGLIVQGFFDHLHPGRKPFG